MAFRPFHLGHHCSVVRFMKEYRVKLVQSLDLMAQQCHVAPGAYALQEAVEDDIISIRATRDGEDIGLAQRVMLAPYEDAQVCVGAKGRRFELANYMQHDMQVSPSQMSDTIQELVKAFQDHPNGLNVTEPPMVHNREVEHDRLNRSQAAFILPFVESVAARLDDLNIPHGQLLPSLQRDMQGDAIRILIEALEGGFLPYVPSITRTKCVRVETSNAFQGSVSNSNHMGEWPGEVANRTTMSLKQQQYEAIMNGLETEDEDENEAKAAPSPCI